MRHSVAKRQMPEESESQIKPRKRWRRRLGILFLLLIAAGVWANGPGARWAIETILPDQLEKQNLSGDFAVSGTLLSGIALENISLQGDYLIQKVEARKVSLSWSLNSLLAKQLESIDIEKLSLELNFDAPKQPGDEKPDEAPVEPAPLSDTLDLVRGFLEPAKISISQLDFKATAAEKEFGLSFASFAHSPGQESYQFRELDITDHRGKIARNQSSTLTWNHETISLDHLQVLQKFALKDLSYEIDGGVAGEINIVGVNLSASSNLDDEFSLSLNSPSLDIHKAAALYDPDLPVSGIISRLTLTQNTILLTGTNLQWEEQSIQSINLEGALNDQDVQADLKAIYQDQRISLIATGTNRFDIFGNETHIQLNYQDQLTAQGPIVLNEEILESSAKLTFNLTYPDVPETSGSIDFAQQQVSLSATALEKIQLEATYDLPSSTYSAKLNGEIQEGGLLHETLTGPLALELSAKGSIPDETHQGTLDLKQANLKEPEIAATASGSWDWPKSVTLDKVQVLAPEGLLEGSVSWQDGFLTVASLNLIESGNTLLKASGKLPAPLNLESLDDVLQSNTPFEFSLASQPLSFERLRKFAPIPENLKGVVEANLDLSGTPSEPQLKGMASLIDFNQSDQPKIPPVDLRTQFRTEDQQLFLDGSAREPGGPLLTLKGDLAFLPAVWLKKEQSPEDAPINLKIQSTKLDLNRVKPFAPAIRSLSGTLETNATISGSLSKPNYEGELTASINHMTLSDSPIADLRDSRIRITAKGQTVTIHPSSFVAAGGKLNLNGKIELAGEEPIFDLSLTGKHVLLTRNADYTFRGHPNLKLRGPLSKASFSGSLAVAESLIYKDVEILPFGVPTTTDIPRPNLPTFSSRSPSKGSSLLVPAPFGNWPLDISVTTADAILIRGNLAKGDLSVNARIQGTIGAPRPSGTIVSNKLKADLPFSNLDISTAVITLQPDDYDNPVISLRGTSTVSQYTVQVFLSGPVQNPNLTLSSNPPLPENEIMLLIATGSPSASLEDRQVASQKALQYLLEGLRRRYGKKDKSVLQRLLKNSDQIELSLGDANQFTGRKFSSATLEIADQWDFTTQIDEQGQTRALVVFSIRFR
ncbi:translocation/assembly module TamB [Akkermansiaceae bacterium]|nr:translocation/assembly module TamB [Akkermansiaceae bacterium]